MPTALITSDVIENVLMKLLVKAKFLDHTPVSIIARKTLRRTRPCDACGEDRSRKWLMDSGNASY